MADDSLIPDDLLRTLVSVGQVDLLVGIPTLNHAETITDVVRAIQSSFLTFFPRQRTVLLNSDGGSTDGTTALVRDCCLGEARTVAASHGLRTTHRISTPYHGVPAKGNAVRLIFAAADLLQASIVVILDPDVSNITPEWVAALALPVRDQRFDFVAPVYRRQPAEGPLVTQLLRPLVRAMFGWTIREPLADEFGCSGPFAAACVEQPVWTPDPSLNGTNLWVTAAALAGPFRSCQTKLGERRVASDRPRPGLPDVFKQVVRSAFQTIETNASYWLPKSDTQDMPVIGQGTDERAETSVLPQDGTRLLESFASDVRNLDEILRAILTPETFASIAAAAGGGRKGPHFPDALWASTVAEFLLAHHRGVMRRDHIIQALLPLYMARTGAFLLEHATGEIEAVEAALESLCVHFEQVRTHVVARWNQSA